jgi:hypothetical protein
MIVLLLRGGSNWIMRLANLVLCHSGPDGSCRIERLLPKEGPDVAIGTKQTC